MDNVKMKNYVDAYHGLTMLLETGTVSEVEFCALEMEMTKKIMRDFIGELGLDESNYRVGKISVMARG